MLNKKFEAYDRSQYALLREAQGIIASEFSRDLKLRDKDIMAQLNVYSSQSMYERLFDIWYELNASLQATKI